MPEGWFVVRARRSNGDRGASLVEFALVVPLLSLFLFGIVQFGIAYDKQQSINSAAREGGRIAVLETTTLQDVGERTVAAADMTAAAGGDLTVTVRDDADNVHGTRNPDGTYVGVSDSAESMPCGEDDDSDGDASTPASEFVRVVVSTPHDLTIPFFGVHSIVIDAKAEFRCE